MPTPVARLTTAFHDRVDATGLSDAAIAAAIGVSKQYYSQVKQGQEAPSARFMAGAVAAGLVQNFGEVAELARPTEAAA